MTWYHLLQMKLEIFDTWSCWSLLWHLKHFTPDLELLSYKALHGKWAILGFECCLCEENGLDSALGQFQYWDSRESWCHLPDSSQWGIHKCAVLWKCSWCYCWVNRACYRLSWYPGILLQTWDPWSVPAAAMLHTPERPSSCSQGNQF